LADVDIEDIADRIGPHVRLKIARTGPGGGRYLTTVRAEYFSLDWLMESFGGGDYHVRAFDGRQYVQSFRIYLDPTVPPKG
jgi:hypothetical protein